MKRLVTLALLGALAVLGAACNSEPAVNKFCKGPDGTVQDCGIACDVTKKEDVCALFKTKTQALCQKAGKKACQNICDKDKNEHACGYVKTMK